MDVGEEGRQVPRQKEPERLGSPGMPPKVQMFLKNGEPELPGPRVEAGEERARTCLGP